MRSSIKSLWDYDVEVSAAFACTEEFERLEKDPLAMDIFLAIGQCHLRGPEFYEDCFRIADAFRAEPVPCQCCGHVAKIETAKDVLDVLRAVARDGALLNPWPPMSRIGYGWSSDPNRDGRIRQDEIDRELRLRELVECVRGRRHVKWHVAPPPPPPEPILFYDI